MKLAASAKLETSLDTKLVTNSTILANKRRMLTDYANRSVKSIISVRAQKPIKIFISVELFSKNYQICVVMLLLGVSKSNQKVRIFIIFHEAGEVLEYYKTN